MTWFISYERGLHELQQGGGGNTHINVSKAQARFGPLKDKVPKIIQNQHNTYRYFKKDK